MGFPSLGTPGDTADPTEHDLCIHTSYVVLSLLSCLVYTLALTCGGPAVTGLGLRAYPGPVTAGGDTRKARRDTVRLQVPHSTLPVMLSQQRGLATDLTQSRLLGAWYRHTSLCPQEARRSLPVSTDTPPVWLSPPCFPDINSRSGSICPSSIHAPDFANFPLFLPPHTHTRLLTPSPPSPHDLPGHRPLFLTPSHSPPSNHRPEEATWRPDVGGGRKGPIRNDGRTPPLQKPRHWSKTLLLSLPTPTAEKKLQLVTGNWCHHSSELHQHSR